MSISTVALNRKVNRAVWGLNTDSVRRHMELIVYHHLIDNRMVATSAIRVSVSHGGSDDQSITLVVTCVAERIAEA